MIREFLKDNILITDGAMGTYYAQITGNDVAFSELSNISDPETIEKIHSEYIEAGAQLIRTNTFAANSMALNVPRQEVKRIVEAGYAIARQAARGKKVFVAADIGPILEIVGGHNEVDGRRVLDEYQFIADTFLAEGAELFVFETFSSTDYLADISRYIKGKNPRAFILTQFTITPDGFTRKGIGFERLVAEARAIGTIDAYGFNCGVGPTHLYHVLKKLDIGADIVAVLPNAGYPEVVHERTIYRQNPEYFSDIMKEIKDLGPKILGGCCGTTPVHIKSLSEKLGRATAASRLPAGKAGRPSGQGAAVPNRFFTKMKNKQFVVAVELDPPFDANVDTLLTNARICQENGIDIITIADSPMAKARVDSVAAAAKIKREIGIETMPHICCRDKNLNALKSTLLAGHMEGIRNILAVTGDAIPSAGKVDIKSVFNVNSVKLIELISRMNQEIFIHDPYYIGGALNLNIPNKQAEAARMLKKAAKGAAFFLTQPIFDEAVIRFLPRMEQRETVKILGGIMPLVSYRNARFLNNEIPGISIPEPYINRFSPDMSREEAENTGIDTAVELAEKMKPYVDGFYFITPFNRIEMIMKIIKRVL
jgi:methionine synthase I (cobalamin-dependent)/5,10-methylenetetrahydrofolate reductase